MDNPHSPRTSSNTTTVVAENESLPGSQSSGPMSIKSDEFEEPSCYEDRTSEIIDLDASTGIGKPGLPERDRPPKYFQMKNGLRSISEIPCRYRKVFNAYPCFNAIQSKMMDDALYSDEPMIVTAPTGSGKTVIFELAIVRLLMGIENKNFKGDFRIVYMAPVKALCSEKYYEWARKFSNLGINCIEVTGDSDVPDLNYLRLHQLILTTPEKWDSLTRKWRDHMSLMQSIRLFFIDEVHILNDENRGPTLEAVVSRMKMLQKQQLHQQLRVREKPQEIKEMLPSLRFVAVSATIPNIEDLAQWLGSHANPAKHTRIDEDLRPVKLERVVMGYPMTSSGFHFDMQLSYKLKNVILQYSDGKPTLVFCSTRKSVETTAKVLSNMATFSLTPLQESYILDACDRLRENKIKDVFRVGIGCHHAGVVISDRQIIEETFRQGHLPVLIATSTLAMGVNLPAHLVVLKSTQHYVAGSYKDYCDSEILQMMGRAGRPQFDTSAVVVIMTSNSCVERYQRLVGGTDPIESSLHRHLAEHVNAEVVLGTVRDLPGAVDWIRSTFLFVRATAQPQKYGLAASASSRDRLNSKLQEMVQVELNGLARYGIVETDGVDVRETPAGRLMARYYIAFDTMKIFMQVSGHETLQELLEILSRAAEFQDVQLRHDEKGALNALNSSKSGPGLRFPIKGRIKTKDLKVNCLLQAALGGLTIHEPALQQDAMRVCRAAERVAKCLSELMALGQSYGALLSATLLAKCVRCRLWENCNLEPRQLPHIGPVLAQLLAGAGKTTLHVVAQSNPRDLERIVNRLPPFGNELREAAAAVPRFLLAVHWSDRGIAAREVIVGVSIANPGVAAFTSKDSFVLIVGDDDNLLLLNERAISKSLMTGDLSRRVDVSRSSAQNLKVNVISENWVGVDEEVTFQLRCGRAEGGADKVTVKKEASAPAKGIAKTKKVPTIVSQAREKLSQLKESNSKSLGAGQSKKSTPVKVLERFAFTPARTATLRHFRPDQQDAVYDEWDDPDDPPPRHVPTQNALCGPSSVAMTPSKRSIQTSITRHLVPQPSNISAKAVSQNSSAVTETDASIVAFYGQRILSPDVREEESESPIPSPPPGRVKGDYDFDLGWERLLEPSSDDDDDANAEMSSFDWDYKSQDACKSNKTEFLLHSDSSGECSDSVTVEVSGCERVRELSAGDAHKVVSTDQLLNQNHARQEDARDEASSECKLGGGFNGAMQHDEKSDAGKGCEQIVERRCDVIQPDKFNSSDIHTVTKVSLGGMCEANITEQRPNQPKQYDTSDTNTTNTEGVDRPYSSTGVTSKVHKVDQDLSYPPDSTVSSKAECDTNSVRSCIVERQEEPLHSNQFRVVELLGKEMNLPIVSNMIQNVKHLREDANKKENGGDKVLKSNEIHIVNLLKNRMEQEYEKNESYGLIADERMGDLYKRKIADEVKNVLLQSESYTDNSFPIAVKGKGSFSSPLEASFSRSSPAPNRALVGTQETKEWEIFSLVDGKDTMKKMRAEAAGQLFPDNVHRKQCTNAVVLPPKPYSSEKLCQSFNMRSQDQAKSATKQVDALIEDVLFKSPIGLPRYRATVPTGPVPLSKGGSIQLPGYTLDPSFGHLTKSPEDQPSHSKLKKSPALQEGGITPHKLSPSVPETRQPTKAASPSRDPVASVHRVLSDFFVHPNPKRAESPDSPRTRNSLHKYTPSHPSPIRERQKADVRFERASLRYATSPGQESPLSPYEIKPLHQTPLSETAASVHSLLAECCPSWKPQNSTPTIPYERNPTETPPRANLIDPSYDASSASGHTLSRAVCSASLTRGGLGPPDQPKKPKMDPFLEQVLACPRPSPYSDRGIKPLAGKENRVPSSSPSMRPRLYEPMMHSREALSGIAAARRTPEGSRSTSHLAATHQEDNRSSQRCAEWGNKFYHGDAERPDRFASQPSPETKVSSVSTHRRLSPEGFRGGARRECNSRAPAEVTLAACDVGDSPQRSIREMNYSQDLFEETPFQWQPITSMPAPAGGARRDCFFDRRVPSSFCDSDEDDVIPASQRWLHQSPRQNQDVVLSLSPSHKPAQATVTSKWDFFLQNDDDSSPPARH